MLFPAHSPKLVKHALFDSSCTPQKLIALEINKPHTGQNQVRQVRGCRPPNTHTQAQSLTSTQFPTCTELPISQNPLKCNNTSHQNFKTLSTTTTTYQRNMFSTIFNEIQLKPKIQTCLEPICCCCCCCCCCCIESNPNCDAEDDEVGDAAADDVVVRPADPTPGFRPPPPPPDCMQTYHPNFLV